MWTFEGTGEVTVNLFTLYSMELVVGLRPWTHPWLLRHRAKASHYLENPGPDRWSRWTSDPGLALWLYAHLQRMCAGDARDVMVCGGVGVIVWCACVGLDGSSSSVFSRSGTHAAARARCASFPRHPLSWWVRQVYDADRAGWPSEAGACRDLFVRLCSQVSARDLRPFFHATWGMPLSACLLAEHWPFPPEDGLASWALP